MLVFSVFGLQVVDLGLDVATRACFVCVCDVCVCVMCLCVCVCVICSDGAEKEFSQGDVELE